MHHQHWLSIFVIMTSVMCPEYLANATTSCEMKYKVNNSEDLLGCTISLPPNGPYTFTVDVNDIYGEGKTPIIPVIKTSPSQNVQNRKESHILDIKVKSYKSEELLTNYIVHKANSVESTRLYFPQFLKQSARSHVNTLALEISTNSNQTISFDLSLSFKNIEVNLNKIGEATISRKMPAVWTFHNNGSRDRRMRIHVNSNMNGCSIVSVQRLNRKGRIYIREADVTYESRWQTMLNQSIIDIDLTNGSKYEDGFVVVVVMKSSDKDCLCNDYDFRIDGRIQSGLTNSQCNAVRKTPFNLTKTIQVVIADIDSSYSDFIYKRDFSTGMVVAIYVVSAMLLVIMALVTDRIPIVGTVLLDEKDVAKIHVPCEKVYCLGFCKLAQCIYTIIDKIYSGTGKLICFLQIDKLVCWLWKFPTSCLINCKSNDCFKKCWNYCFTEDTTDSSDAVIGCYITWSNNSKYQNTMVTSIDETAGEPMNNCVKTYIAYSNPNKDAQLKQATGQDTVDNSHSLSAYEDESKILSRTADQHVENHSNQTQAKKESTFNQEERPLNISRNETLNTTETPLVPAENGQSEQRRGDETDGQYISRGNRKKVEYKREESVKSNIKNVLENQLNLQGVTCHELKSRRSLIQGRREEKLKMSSTTSTFESNVHLNRRRMKSRIYPYVLALMGICYALPAGQLMYVAQHISKETGTEDMCFYNYLCRYNAGWLDDYGHVFSNIAYVVSGLLFIILVRIRQWKRRIAMLKYWDEKSETNQCIIPKDDPDFNVECLNEVGIPEQYGLFYAMGVALILEGIMSSAYHLCPVNESFQFDTTFMYIIAALIYTKVYQFRHPDISPKAYVIFMVISIMLIFEVIGYYAPTGPGFMVSFLVFYVTFIIIFYHKMYFQGDRNFDIKLRQKSRSKRVFCVLVTTFNVGLAIFFLVHRNNTSVISKYLLVIFGSNMAFYVFFYVGTKYFRSVKKGNKNESLTWTTWIYILLALGFSAVGVVLFKQMERDSKISPALSRQLNQECTLGIFDKHDLWHFMSAAGLFFTFMTTLTMEDNNTGMPRKELAVF